MTCAAANKHTEPEHEHLNPEQSSPANRTSSSLFLLVLFVAADRNRSVRSVPPPADPEATLQNTDFDSYFTLNYFTLFGRR